MIKASRDALISKYWSVVAAASCSSVVLMFVAADARLSKWLSSCAMRSSGLPGWPDASFPKPWFASMPW